MVANIFEDFEPPSKKCLATPQFIVKIKISRKVKGMLFLVKLKALILKRNKNNIAKIY